jgi:hypothetical protein
VDHYHHIIGVLLDSIVLYSFGIATSRENYTAGARKTLILGEFGLASDHHAGGNGLPPAHHIIRQG